MNKFHIFRAQFRLILSFAMTIHKGHGLSLDCAIIVLSDKIFADGMTRLSNFIVTRLEVMANTVPIAPLTNPSQHYTSSNGNCQYMLKTSGIVKSSFSFFREASAFAGNLLKPSITSVHSISMMGDFIKIRSTFFS